MTSPMSMRGDTMPRAAVFLDKDGTLLADVPYNIDPLLMRLAPGAHEALRIFAALDVPLYVISNQSGVALGKFANDALTAVDKRLRELVHDCGATLSGIYWCTHHPDGTVAPYNRPCDCRKPAPGMLLHAAREHAISLVESWFIGDILDDVEAGHRAGCRTVLIDNGNETVWRRGPFREPDHVVTNLHQAALATQQSTFRRELTS
ncbi:MAG: family hydrolase [Caballeronia mineralivorans]|jgi:D-glycero-D-manno-heptose 1,7-bisphosphate phosphatase|nr:family hydrolase [Caballeronia mineralivorans]